MLVDKNRPYLKEEKNNQFSYKLTRLGCSRLIWVNRTADILHYF